jgi:uncharacterized protein (TIRG00374 family)
VLLAATVFVKALRWRSLFLPGARPPLGAVVEATLLGYLYLTVLPGRAGELPRIVVLSRRSGIPKLQIAATALVERVFDVVALLILFFAFSPWWPPSGWARPLAWLAGALGIGLLVAVVLLRISGERGLRLVLRPLGWLPRVGRERAEAAALTLRDGLAGLHDLPTAALALGLTIVSWLLLGCSCAVTLRALHLHVSPLAGMLVMIAVCLAASLPSLPAGIGIVEAATVKALETYGVARPQGLALGVIWHALNIVPFLVVGPALALILRRRARTSP